MAKLPTQIRTNIEYIAWFQALIATLGSLFYSEVLHIIPCILCWYQRILMYPLVIIIAVGIIKKDRNLPYFVLPMSILGLLIAAYHYLLQFGIIPENLAPCVEGISCASRYIQYYDFITIPLMAFTAFTVITISMVISLKSQKSNS